MKTLRMLSPHAAVLIGNMYYVFWGIDRVNKTMNFIDNEYTKLLLMVFAGVNASVLAPFLRRQLRGRRARGPVYARMALLGANVLLAAVTLALLGADLFIKDSTIFLSEFVKAVVLALCIVSQLSAVYMASRQRAGVRAMNRRRARK